MRIIVCVKQVVDLDQVRMNRETREPILANLPMMVGQIEKNALEEAAKIKEKDQAEIIVLFVGWPFAEEVVLECLARGADQAITIPDQSLQQLSAQGVALILAKAINKIGKFDLIMLGDGSTDNNSGQVGPAIAEILGIPLLSYARQVQMSQGKVTVIQSFEDSFETVQAPSPVLVTVTSEINEPRIPSIIEVMDASSKPQQKWSLSDIGLSLDDLKPYLSIKTLKNQYPEQVRKNVVLKEANLDKNIALLIQNLMKEGVLES